MTPAELANKIISRVLTDKETTYDILEARAKERGLDTATFEAAMTITHRSKLIERSVVGGVIRYKVAPPKLPPVVAGATWVTDNYPWPGKDGVPEFIMPFPEIDMSHLFLSGEELEKYKCEAKGRPYIPGKRKAYEYSRG